MVASKDSTNEAKRITKIHKAPFQKLIPHISGFPNLVTYRQLRPRLSPFPGQVYSRSLFSAGHGYPMFYSKLNPDFPSPFDKRGICIGDVGHLEGADGLFYFAFNMFLPLDDPLHVAFPRRIPPGFVPLSPPDESELVTIQDYFLPGSVVVSKGVEVTRLSESPLHLTFSSSEPEAAFLTLPHGASRTDMKVANRMNEYLKQHGSDWIRHFGEHLSNGTLYVVTGHDKTRSCYMAAFPAPRTVGPRKMSAEYIEGEGLTRRSGSIGSAHVEGSFEDQCVFLRGIRVSISGSEWDRQRLEDVSPESAMGPAAHISIMLYTPPLSDQLDYEPEISVDSEDTDTASSDAGAQAEHEAGVNEDASVRSDSSSWSSDNEYAEEEPSLAVQHYPFHPSDVIAQVMFNECSQANLALVDDHIWSVFRTQNSHDNLKAPLISICPAAGFASDFGSLLETIFKFHDIVNANGAIVVAPKSKKKPHYSWLSNLRRMRWSKRSCEADHWGLDLVADLVRQGEDMLGDHKHSISF